MSRKITTESVNAFYRKENFKKANMEIATDANQTAMFLHGNKIAKIEGGKLYITNAGWDSRTTYERLNGLDGVRVNKVKGITHLNGVAWDGKWTEIK